MPNKPPQTRDNHSTPADDKVRKPVLEKLALHPRNRHRGRYDFAVLTAALPALQDFLIPNPFDANERTINFADPIAVKTLNTALLKQQYGIDYWEIPADYLCPPIPGRADYLHHTADLLARYANDAVPRGPLVRVLDIGVGANCIYPLIGQHEYGWQFVGTDIDAVAIAAAQKIIDSNKNLAELITLRLQPSTKHVFEGVVSADERFDIVICNPPFHASAQAAAAGSLRKWKNLGKARKAEAKPTLNFGGQALELWCEGGELGFIRRMITESAQRKKQVLWFTTLVSKEDHLPEIYEALRAVNVPTVETIDMAQGQKKSRIVAWTFFKENDAKDWVGARST
jgi:23S rRNA (adenine1618-N6)-methyltransferase